MTPKTKNPIVLIVRTMETVRGRKIIVAFSFCGSVSRFFSTSRAHETIDEQIFQKQKINKENSVMRKCLRQKIFWPTNLGAEKNARHLVFVFCLAHRVMEKFFFLFGIAIDIFLKRRGQGSKAIDKIDNQKQNTVVPSRFHLNFVSVSQNSVKKTTTK